MSFDNRNDSEGFYYFLIFICILLAAFADSIADLFLSLIF